MYCVMLIRLSCLMPINFFIFHSLIYQVQNAYPYYFSLLNVAILLKCIKNKTFVVVLLNIFEYQSSNIILFK